MESPLSRDVTVCEPTATLVGRTRAGAAFAVNAATVEPDAEGRFRHTVRLTPGPNLIVVSARGASGEERSVVLTVRCER